MVNIEIKGLLINNTLENLIGSDFNISYEEFDEYYFWELEYIPETAGVYVIFDEGGDCLYVGSTPLRFDLRGRIKEHLKDAFFREYGHKVHYYKTEENTIDILLLERIFIKALNPPFNNDLNDEEMSELARAYIDKYHLIRHSSNWKNLFERDARLAEVPIIIDDLKHDVEELYGEMLEEIPQLNEGNISLPTFYAKLKKLQKEFNTVNNIEMGFDDFIKLVSASLVNRNFTIDQLSYLVLLNKSLPQSLIKKFKK